MDDRKVLNGASDSLSWENLTCREEKPERLGSGRECWVLPTQLWTFHCHCHWANSLLSYWNILFPMVLWRKAESFYYWTYASTDYFCNGQIYTKPNKISKKTCKHFLFQLHHVKSLEAVTTVNTTNKIWKNWKLTTFPRPIWELRANHYPKFWKDIATQIYLAATEVAGAIQW